MNKKLKGLLITFTTLIIVSVAAAVVNLMFFDNKGMKKSQTVTNSNSQKEEEASNGDTYRVIAYYSDWSVYDREVNVDSIDGSLVTHVNVAFANIDETGKIKIGDEYADLQMTFGDALGVSANGNGVYGQMGLLKKKYPHIKVLIAVGGWTWSKQLVETVESPKKREVFAKSCAQFVSQYGFDGVDIDWDQPELLTTANPKKDMLEFMKVVRQALDEQEKIDKKEYSLTLAGPANQAFLDTVDAKQLSKYVDFYNIMTYDIHGAWEDTTNFNAPLYGDNSVDSLLKMFLKEGFDSKDLNMGLAFYGRGWTNVTSDQNGLYQKGSPIEEKGYGKGTWEAGIFDYWDLAQNYLNRGEFTRYFDEEAKVPYLFNGKTFITYDDEQSIGDKMDYVKENHLGGAMFWEFSGDKNKELQSVVAEKLGIGNRK